MTRGLLWLPLLAVFIGLAWAGWNEYQKLEVYRGWAEQFDRAKFDIYSVLGQKEGDLTWGKPTRKGILNLQTFSRQQVESIYLLRQIAKPQTWKTRLLKPVMWRSPSIYQIPRNP